MADADEQQSTAAAEMQRSRLEALNESKMPAIPSVPANPEAPAENEGGAPGQEAAGPGEQAAAPAPGKAEEEEQRLELAQQSQAALDMEAAKLQTQTKLTQEQLARVKQEEASSGTARAAGQLAALANKYPIVKAILVALKFVYAACGTNCLMALLFILAIVGSIVGFPPNIFILPIVIPIAAAVVIIFWDKIRIFVEAVMSNTSIFPTPGQTKK